VTNGFSSKFYAFCSSAQTLNQSWTRIGCIHGLDWIGLGWIGLGRTLEKLGWIGLDWIRLRQMGYVILCYLFIFIYLLLRQMAAHIKYTNQYTKEHTIHSIKRNYKLGLQFV